MATHGEYKIVMSTPEGSWEQSADQVELQVCELMLQGWQPYFGLIIIETRLAQVMLWEGEEGEDDTPA